MIDVTLTVGTRNFSSRLSTYAVPKEVEYAKTITTIDGTERYIGRRDRDVVRFSLIPTSESDALADYTALSGGTVTVSYTDPNGGITKSNVEMSVSSNIEKVFALKSVDGNRYYKGGEIVLRATHV